MYCQHTQELGNSHSSIKKDVLNHINAGSFSTQLVAKTEIYTRNLGQSPTWVRPAP